MAILKNSKAFFISFHAQIGHASVIIVFQNIRNEKRKGGVHFQERFIEKRHGDKETLVDAG
jgi:hypothetical protein